MVPPGGDACRNWRARHRKEIELRIMAKHAKRSKRSRITGVAAKIRRKRATLKAIIQYLLDLLQHQQKLYCPPWIQQIRLPKPAAGKDLTPPELLRALTKEVDRILEGVQVNRAPVVEITLSLAPGEVWSPRQWQKFWHRFLHHLGRVTYVTDHCVSRTRKPVTDENGETQMRMRRSNPPQFFQAHLHRYLAIVPIHDNTDSQHLQAMLMLWDLSFRQVAVINDEYTQIAVQWAARRAEQDFQLSPHPNMPDYPALIKCQQDEKSGLFVPVDDRLRVVEPQLIKLCGRGKFVFKEKRPPRPNKTQEPSLKSQIMRNETPAVLRMRAILKDRTPEQFSSLAELGRFLLSRKAGLLRPKTAGLHFCVGGSLAKPKEVNPDWSSPLLLQRWPKLQKRGRIVGMSPKAQKLTAANQNTSRLQAAGIGGTQPSRQELAYILRTAHQAIEGLPWKSLYVEERRLDGTTQRCGELTTAELEGKITAMFTSNQPILDQTLHFRPPLPPDVAAIPLWGLNRRNAERLQKNYHVALLSEDQPGNFNALLLVQGFPGELWQNKRAIRRLTLWLAKRYQATPSIVVDDGIPLPGLPSLAGTGHPPLVIGQARNETCPTLSRRLVMLGTRLARLEAHWEQGQPGRILRNQGRRILPPTCEARARNAWKIYLDNVRVLAKNPLRCATLDETNARIAARMRGLQYKPLEILAVFQSVKALWPELVPGYPDDCLDAPSQFKADYSRDERLFKRIPLTPISPPLMSRAEILGSQAASPALRTDVELTMRADAASPAKTIQPDFVYTRGEIPVLAHWFSAARKAVEDIIARLAPVEQPKPVSQAVEAQEGEHTRSTHPDMLTAGEELKHRRRPPASVFEPPPLSSPSARAQIPDIKTAADAPQPTRPAANPQPVAAPTSTPSEMPPPLRQPMPRPVKRQPAASVTAHDPESSTKATAIVPPPITPDLQEEEKESKRRKRREQSYRLEAIGGWFIFMGKKQDALALLERCELQFKTMLVFDRLWASLSVEPDRDRFEGLRQWAFNTEIADPEWLADQCAVQESALNAELETKLAAKEPPTLQTTVDILTR